MLTTIMIGGLEFDILNRDPGSPIEVVSVTGLSQVDYELASGSYAGGGSYTSGRLQTRRNVVFNLKLRPDWINNRDLRQIREQLFKTFVPMSIADDDQPVPIDIFLRYSEAWTDRVIRNAYTEKIEVDIFSRQPTAHISVVSDDQNIYSSNSNNLSWGDWAGPRAFSFVPAGNIPSGFTASFTLRDDSTLLEVWNTTGSPQDRGPLLIVAPTADELRAGDVIVVNTRRNERLVRRIRGGSVRNIAGWVHHTSKWPVIFPDRNNTVSAWHGYEARGLYPQFLTFEHTDVWMGA